MIVLCLVISITILRIVGIGNSSNCFEILKTVGRSLYAYLTDITKCVDPIYDHTVEPNILHGKFRESILCLQGDAGDKSR